ncbi:PREDICTED: uncharacterized protein LOC104991806 [Bison bison bison]|uniref:Uncharacterized protein LOC104991806 n=2 Tax=Boreoeutheria TaxID=1437010 RepID=A0A6P3HTR6_BISBB|nr:PREDICTED: uncharacterized protein LOC104991806 [Bison bison bison]
MVGTPRACWHLVLPPHLSAWAARPGSVPALCPASRGQSTGRECPGAGLHRGGAPWAGACVGAAAPGSLPGQGGPAVLRNASRGRQRSSGLRKSGGAHPQCLPPFDIPLCFVNQQELEEIRKCGMKNFRNIQVDEANLLTWQGLIVPVSTGQLPSSSPDGAGRRADGRLPGLGKAVCADRTPSADQPPPPLGRAGGSRLVLCLRSCPAVRLSPVLCAPASWFPPGTAPSPAPARASCCLSPCPASLLVSLGSRPGSAPRPAPCHPAASVHAQPLRRGLLWPPCPLGSAAPLSAALPNSPCRDASLKDSSGDPSFPQCPPEVSGLSPRPSVLSCACPQPVQSLSAFCLLGILLLFSSEVPAWQCRHEGAIPGSGRSPGKGNGNPFQYSCLGWALNWDPRTSAPCLPVLLPPPYPLRLKSLLVGRGAALPELSRGHADQRRRPLDAVRMLYFLFSPECPGQSYQVLSCGVSSLCGAGFGGRQVFTGAHSVPPGEPCFKYTVVTGLAATVLDGTCVDQSGLSPSSRRRGLYLSPRFLPLALRCTVCELLSLWLSRRAADYILVCAEKCPASVAPAPGTELSVLVPACVHPLLPQWPFRRHPDSCTEAFRFPPPDYGLLLSVSFTALLNRLPECLAHCNLADYLVVVSFLKAVCGVLSRSWLPSGEHCLPCIVNQVQRWAHCLVPALGRLHLFLAERIASLLAWEALGCRVGASNRRCPVLLLAVIQSLIALVNDPQPEHPLRADLAEEYSKDRKKFCKNAEEFTKKYGEKRPVD